nr:immunoglobulin light chain junction region [Macaca mulatta]
DYHCSAWDSRLTIYMF